MNRLYIRAHESQVMDDDQESQNPYALVDQFEWILLSPAGDVLNSGHDKSAAQLQDALKEQSLSYHDLVFIPPEHRVQVRRITLAKGQHRHAEQVIPFLLEESLAQSPDELHYTLLNKTNKESPWVSIVAQQVMASWLADLQALGWQHCIILPVNSALPFWPEQGESELDFIFTSETHLLYRDEDSVSCLPLSARAYLPKRDSYHLCCNQQELADFEGMSASFESLTTWSNQLSNHKGKLESWLYVVATRLQSNSQFFHSNLCHGQFGRQTQVWSQVKPWLWVAVFALFSFATELYLTVKETQELKQQADSLYQESSAAFLRLAPDEGRVSYLDRQIKGRIQRAKQGQAETKKSLTVYEVMAMVDQVRAKVKGDQRITKLDYANKEYRIDWQAEQREVLDTIQAELDKQPLHVIFEQVAKRGDVYVASIKLKEETR